VSKNISKPKSLVSTSSFFFDSSIHFLFLTVCFVSKAGLGCIDDHDDDDDDGGRQRAAGREEEQQLYIYSFHLEFAAVPLHMKPTNRCCCLLLLLRDLCNLRDSPG
jgi:hypothetical protein